MSHVAFCCELVIPMRNLIRSDIGEMIWVVSVYLTLSKCDLSGRQFVDPPKEREGKAGKMSHQQMESTLTDDGHVVGHCPLVPHLRAAQWNTLSLVC